MRAISCAQCEEVHDPNTPEDREVWLPSHAAVCPCREAVCGDCGATFKPKKIGQRERLVSCYDCAPFSGVFSLTTLWLSLLLVPPSARPCTGEVLRLLTYDDSYPRVKMRALPAHRNLHTEQQTMVRTTQMDRDPRNRKVPSEAHSLCIMRGQERQQVPCGGREGFLAAAPHGGCVRLPACKVREVPQGAQVRFIRLSSPCGTN